MVRIIIYLYNNVYTTHLYNVYIVYIIIYVVTLDGQSSRLIHKYLTGVSSLRFLRLIGIVSDRQTTFIARYISDMHLSRQYLVTSIPLASRNFQRETDQVYFYLCIRYVHNKVTSCRLDSFDIYELSATVRPRLLWVT